MATVIDNEQREALTKLGQYAKKNENGNVPSTLACEIELTDSNGVHLSTYQIKGGMKIWKLNCNSATTFCITLEDQRVQLTIDYGLRVDIKVKQLHYGTSFRGSRSSRTLSVAGSNRQMGLGA